MLVVVILMFLILAFSLYQYVDNSEWNEFRANNRRDIYQNRNKKYGAYAIQSKESNVLAYISIGCIVLGVLAIYAKVIVNNYEGVSSMTFSEVSDTTQFTLSNQNIQETPPSQFNFDGNNGDGLPEAKDGGERPTDRPETTERSEQADKREPNKTRNPDQSIQDFEKEQFDQAGGAAERQKILDDMEKRKLEREEKKKQQQQKVQGGAGGKVGTNSGTQGKTLAEWNMNGRKPHQNNPDFIKIPGYMCGKGINEKIVVKVKVNSNGEVYWAQSMAPETANACCVEQALAYAKKSRFEYSEKPIDEGTITYYFKAQ